MQRREKEKWVVCWTWHAANRCSSQVVYKVTGCLMTKQEARSSIMRFAPPQGTPVTPFERPAASHATPRSRVGSSKVYSPVDHTQATNNCQSPPSAPFPPGGCSIPLQFLQIDVTSDSDSDSDSHARRCPSVSRPSSCFTGTHGVSREIALLPVSRRDRQPSVDLTVLGSASRGP